MKHFAATVFLALSGALSARAQQDIPGWTSAETRTSLVCAISSSSNSVAFASRIPAVLTLRNIGSADIEMPHPFGGEMNMEIRFYLLNTQTGNRALNSPLHIKWNPSETKGVKTAQGWIKLSPNEQREIRLFVDIPSTNSESESMSSLSPGSYGLECEIEYHVGDILSGRGMFLVDRNTTEQDIEKYKRGRVLLYAEQVWTGKVKSDVLPIILTAGPK